MTKGKYVDGFVFSVPREREAEYKKMAREAARVWKRFGALDYKECVAADVHPEHVTFTFPKMAKTKEGEAVWFSYVVYRSKKHRDEVVASVMAYFDKKYKDKGMQDMPFDMKRFATGGFKVEVSM